MNLQENRGSGPNFRQIQLQQFRRFLLTLKHFGIFHGRLVQANFGAEGDPISGIHRRVTGERYPEGRRIRRLLRHTAA
jgi:hypothetical protein